MIKYILLWKKKIKIGTVADIELKLRLLDKLKGKGVTPLRAVFFFHAAGTEVKLHCPASRRTSHPHPLPTVKRKKKKNVF